MPHYTVEDYRLWEGDWELWNGVAVAMTPSPFGRHSRLLVSVGSELKSATEACGCNATVLAEIDWIVSADTVLRPDLIVVCGAEPERHVEETPAIAVEILSDSTRERDLTYKRSIYQQQKLPCYLIVDPDTSQLMVLQLNQDGQYVDMPATGDVELVICDDCRLTIQVDRLFR